MKFTALVLRNHFRSVCAVEFPAVTDALLSGGVPLSEVVLAAYDDTALVKATLSRLSEESDGVFLICDDVLLSAAREAVEVVTGEQFPDGTLHQAKNCLYAVLPAGKEGARAVREEVLPVVDGKRGQSFYSVVIKTVGAPREEVIRATEEAAKQGGVFIHTSEEYGVGKIEIAYHSASPKVAVDEAVRIVADELGKYVYAMEDVTPGQRLFEALKLHRLHLSTAESFTGGGVGEEIVKNPGASKVFYEGLNTYDGLSKQERLGVSPYTLQSKGAVSGDTAYEMAAGLLKTGHCDIAIATTGIAGPKSDGTRTPAGTCFIAIGTGERVRVFEFHLTGDRTSVTRQAINLALFHAYKEIR